MAGASRSNNILIGLVQVLQVFDYRGSSKKRLTTINYGIYKRDVIRLPIIIMRTVSLRLQIWSTEFKIVKTIGICVMDSIR